MIQQSHSWHLSRENHDSQRHTYSNIHCSTIFNSQDMETTKMAIDRGVDQEGVVHIHNGILLSAFKRNEIPALFGTWMDLEIIILSEVSHTMRHQHQMLSLTCGI